jgi:hypothetical protein
VNKTSVLGIVIAISNPLGCGSLSPIDWPFKESKNTIAVTQRSIANEQLPILTVLRDSVDGQWFFFADENPTIDPEVLLTLEDIVKIDKTITELGDLLPGWKAWRSARGQSWYRQRL